VRWLRRLGFTLHEAVPYGALGEPFHPFEMRDKPGVSRPPLPPSAPGLPAVAPLQAPRLLQAPPLPRAPLLQPVLRLLPPALPPPA
jgi:hypothetical protein